MIRDCSSHVTVFQTAVVHDDGNDHCVQNTTFTGHSYLCFDDVVIMQYSGSKEGEPCEIFFSSCDGFVPCEGCLCLD